MSEELLWHYSQDYPIYASVPETGFSCASPGRVAGGYYADTEAECQVSCDWWRAVCSPLIGCSPSTCAPRTPTPAASSPSPSSAPTARSLTRKVFKCYRMQNVSWVVFGLLRRAQGRLGFEFQCQFIETLNVSYVLYVVDANYELHCCIVNLWFSNLWTMPISNIWTMARLDITA